MTLLETRSLFRNLSPGPGGYSLKTRLYSIIAFLGLLPVLGVALALLAVELSRRDDAALDRVARGTINLERVNGLVYAVVMESRGIYMSADWGAAEPFANNLVRQLGELQDVARAWKADAIASQQSNIEDLAERIDQFVRFRTELVRLGKEESTTAARAFGDNDANRSVRTALNNNLHTVAHAYEQEIAKARTRVEADERYFLAILSAVALLGAAALGGGLLFVKTALLAPVLRMRDSMLHLAQGELDFAMDGRQRAREFAEMAKAVEVFHTTLVDRQKLNREARLLSDLNEWLQSCNTLGELYQMVAEFLGRLLPGCAGSLYIYANSRDVLESAKAWNGGKMTPAMHPDDCWGLRRGRPYTFGETEIDFRCSHLDPSVESEYCCIPILAHGETIGLLHLEFASENGEPRKEAIAEQRRLGLVCAEQISLAIANVKLRDQLRDQSIRDVLTGLFNRRYMLETCRRAFSRAARAGQHISILSIDVDHFKKYNDNHGHDAGDMVLRAVGNCLESLFRNEDIPCRFGGEEFVVILPGADADAAARRAEQLRSKVEDIVVRYLEKNLPRITVSIGVAVFPDADDNPQAVLKAADQALYRAKEKGRNRVELSGATAMIADASTAQPVAMQRALA
ncbi:MAG: sensor domain-containing diguanylate cyclase, partial [Alphaproteobacteria bacterium]|nr:sensor domain-containing diguanylate cyclase [Alphaproteobacteria bacterium]